VEAAGCAFAPWTLAPSRPDRSRASDLARDWEAPGPAGFLRVIDAIICGPALAYARDLAAELAREPADLVVTSELLSGVAAGCEALGQPYVELAVNVSHTPLPGVPPMGPGLSPARDAAEAAKHAEIAERLIGLLDHGLPALNAARRELGLPPLAHVADQAKSAQALLLATSRAFDFAPESLPPHVRYVGPQLGEPAWAAPLELAEDPRPLVAVGFSTTFQNHAAILQRVADALADLPALGVITLGPGLEPGEVRGHDNVQVVAGASHDALMQRARVVVTHGGHGTVCRALTHGRPLLVIPHGRDQNDNAVRVTARHAGLSLTPEASTEAIRAALRRLLEEPAFKENAERLGAAVARDVRDSPVVEVLEAEAAAARALCPA
jgi:UDP:flavonoid glycosyltransferase YjiC (YdhE family)